VATALQNSAARQTDGQASKWQTRKLYSTVGNSLRWKAAITFAFNLSLFVRHLQCAFCSNVNITSSCIVVLFVLAVGAVYYPFDITR